MFCSISYNKEFFEKIEYVKNNVEYDNNDWKIVSISTIMKENFKDEVAKLEIISAYFHAAEILKDNLCMNDGIPGLRVISSNSVCLPFLYMCRQTTELAIKYALNVTCQNYKQITHNIKKLWEDFCINNKQYIYENDKWIINTITQYVDVLSKLDSDGCHFRYATSNDEKLYRNKTEFINPKNFIEGLSLIILAIKNFDAKVLIKIEQNCVKS